MSEIGCFKLRTLLASSGVTIAALAVLLLLVVADDGRALSGCGTGFTVVTASTPTLANLPKERLIFQSQPGNLATGGPV